MNSIYGLDTRLNHPKLLMDWTLKQGNRDECLNPAYLLYPECLRSSRISSKAPDLRGSGANLDWIRVRLKMSGGGRSLKRTRLPDFPVKQGKY